MSHNSKPYQNPDEKPQMVSEPVAAHAIPKQHHAVFYAVHKIKTEKASNATADNLVIPETYEEALSMGAMDLEDAKKELLKYVDELAEEFHLP